MVLLIRKKVKAKKIMKINSSMNTTIQSNNNNNIDAFFNNENENNSNFDENFTQQIDIGLLDFPSTPSSTPKKSMTTTTNNSKTPSKQNPKTPKSILKTPLHKMTPSKCSKDSCTKLDNHNNKTPKSSSSSSIKKH
ncbi:expressed protein, partial [Dictyostelium purpureum]